ncbi:hypothetical protein G7070_08520 [Propioniciclava coleopterorum]|uniref:Trypsin n=1 Tax=Propioniciclava coleopterorum TaxID=2714937 RepID=A0A6G7Y693_9ACTN|nr:S1 family peptidase [Propioniciclava coleopterorum]QIK72303.1 hypothetical protein G7070_08520 [Propioniciclava coleopterorum]
MRPHLLQFTATAVTVALVASLHLGAPREAPAAEAPPGTTQRVAGQARDLADLGALETAHPTDPDAALAALVDAALTSAPLEAGTPALLDDTPILDNLDAAELMGLLQLARDDGRSAPDVIRQYGAQDATAAAADALATDYPETFVGAELNRADGSNWFGFVGDVPEAALTRIAALPAPSDVTSGLAHSRARLEALALDLTSGLSIASSSWPEFDAQRLVYRVHGGDPALRRAALERARGIAGRAGVALDASIEPGGVTAEDGYARGGMTVKGHNSGKPQGTCTGGFIMKTSTGGRRMSSAGHCGQAMQAGALLRLRAIDGGNSAPVRETISWDNRDGDLALFTLGTFKPMAVFYAKSSLKVSVRGWNRWSAKGTSLCKFGVTTGFTCDVVDRTGFTHMGTGELVKMRQGKSDHGDSGGPWFSGHTAYGIHSGRTLISRDSFYTRLNGFVRHDTYVVLY